MTSLTQTVTTDGVPGHSADVQPDNESLRTLATMLSGKRNAFGFLRFVLASLVLVDHMYPLGGYGEDPMWGWSKRQDSSGGLAVAGFFAISGYLITKSAIRTQVVPYLWHRMLRILPALWLCLGVTAFVLGPFVWWYGRGTLSGYFVRGVGGPFAYFTSNLGVQVHQYGIHDLLIGTPYGLQVKASVFNGSLWTLIYEWRSYIVVGLLAGFGVLRGAKPLVFVTAVILWFLTVLQIVDPTIPGRIAPWLSDIYNVRLPMIFMIGAVFAVYADKIPVNDRLGGMAAFLVVVSLFTGGYIVLGYPALAYLMLWLAARLRGPFRRVGAVNDYSYGIYIYGFLIQQLLAGAGVNRWGKAPYLSLTFVLTLLCALASWHLLEKHALRLKHWGPGQGGMPFARDILALVRRSLVGARDIATNRSIGKS
jgi:peptidoglycan/LPS O-acetylase OafA/YrhL